MSETLITHSKLVEYAATWLRSRCSIVITEVASGAGEEPDAIGFKGSQSVLIECKASRNDFLSDSKKYYRRDPERGMGDNRYYCCSKGLIKETELPEKWGLIEIDPDKKRKIIVKLWSEYFKKSANKEIALLISVIRKIGQNPISGVSVRCYTYETKNRATLGIQSG